MEGRAAKTFFEFREGGAIFFWTAVFGSGKDIFRPVKKMVSRLIFQ